MTNNRAKNFSQADKILSEKFNKTHYLDKTWTKADVEAYRAANNLSWHEMSNMESIQLVPTDVNRIFTHTGGVAEYNAMIGLEEGAVFD